MKQVFMSYPFSRLPRKKVQAIPDSTSDIARTHHKLFIDYLLFNILPR